MSKHDDKLTNMTSSTIGRDLLQAMIDEFKQQPKHWKQLSQLDQEMVIERLSTRIDNLIKRALHIMASKDRAAILGTMDSVTIKSGVKATISISKNSPHILDLYENTGQPMLLIAASHAEFTDGMDTVVGESDQPDLLDPLDEEEGEEKPAEDPSIFERLKEMAHPAPRAEPSSTKPTTGMDVDPSGLLVRSSVTNSPPNEFGVYTCKPDIFREWKVKDNRIEIELLHLSSGDWIYSILKQSKTGHSSTPLKFYPDRATDKLSVAIQEIVDKLDGHPLGNLTGPQKASLREFITSLAEIDELDVMRELGIRTIDHGIQQANELSQNTEPVNEQDPLYDQAILVAKQKNNFGISTLQRQLKIGYNRSARLIENMVTKGDVIQLTTGKFSISPNII
ncbi:DNA translocase FtsK [Ampullimonas aquatilis]|uniref:DNA translocase FtsK n=1 Tax=Ampullimonas aquatilis TaxID=1341549 RepID=UPI003C731CC1